MDFLKRPENKSIVITDSDSTWPALIREMNGQPVFIALCDIEPDVDAISTSDMMNTVYCMGEVTKDRIDFRLYDKKMEYWTASGDYWVLIALMNKPATRISRVYLSKKMIPFYSERTYLTNTDFMEPVDVDIEIDSIRPF
jgi:hypothetical protein